MQRPRARIAKGQCSLCETGRDELGALKRGEARGDGKRDNLPVSRTRVML